MAQRRMFSIKIIDSDLFLDMPCSTQLLYFHLSMRADDDGFISSPKKICKMVNCSDDDMRLLIAKTFIIPFESGICVIKHWKIHNYIQNDRYSCTLYKEEKEKLSNLDGVYGLDTERIQNGYKTDTQVRLGKVRLELGKDRLLLEPTKVDSSNKLQPIIEQWNSLNLSKIINVNGNRLKMLNSRIKEHGIDEVLKAIELIKTSSFLKGQNSRNWIITFDWFIKPSNFIKVLEGNYSDKQISNSFSARNNTKKSIHNFTGRDYTEEDYKNIEDDLILNKPVNDTNAKELLEEYKKNKALREKNMKG